LFVCFEIKGGLAANGPRKLHKKGNCVQSDLKPSCEVGVIYTLRKEELDMKP